MALLDLTDAGVALTVGYATMLVGLIAGLPHLGTIAFNGGTAARLGMKVLGQHAQRYRIVPLPSSSPAYTLAYAEKLTVWQTVRDYLPL